MSSAAVELNRASALAQSMCADAMLPDDFVPGPASTAVPEAVLVTGATGFLGRYVVRELLLRHGGDIVCLVRAATPLAARTRLADSLQLAGIDVLSYATRLKVVVGAVEQFQFGFNDDDYLALANRIDRIYHCAAEVNWARSYRQLRGTNVIGTREAIRLACTGARKRLCYVSTIAVCFGTEVPAEIDERTDMLPHIAQMPLPYAQTKCVSESLLRDAANRGLPVCIIRPALISGDSKSGVANPDDLISALIQGCVASRSAIDTDWLLDCVPVDYVARVLVRLGETGQPDWTLLNLFNERGRHWREVVLWMNLYGYPVELVKPAEWLHRTFDRLSVRCSLFRYRRFFGATDGPASGPAPYESYLGSRQERVQNSATLQTIADLGVSAAPLDTGLLERYLEYYRSAGLLPKPQRSRKVATARPQDACPLEQILSGWLEAQDLRLTKVSETGMGTHNGIFNEVATARLGGRVGMRRFQLTLRERDGRSSRKLDLLLKSKPSDLLMQDLLVEVATLCDPELGACFETFKHDLGLAGCHERELAIYEQAGPALRRFMPSVFGTFRDVHKGTWSIAMEYLPEAKAVNVAGHWSGKEVRAVLRGLARLHAVWYGREAALQQQSWVGQPPSTERMLALSPLWIALAKHSAVYFDEWLDEPVLCLQKLFIENLGAWWPELRGMRQSLVHNDCNPRNFVIRRTNDELVPLFFDWELATIDVPQRDVAEMLCFMLPATAGPGDIADLVAVHRRELDAAAGVLPDDREWWLGFNLALRHLLIDRLPLYTVMQRFRPQPFLPAVMRNWQKLYDVSKESVRTVPKRQGSDVRYCFI